jgi:hypothetical protein
VIDPGASHKQAVRAMQKFFKRVRKLCEDDPVLFELLCQAGWRLM